jgi:hypothetical protein
MANSPENMENPSGGILHTHSKKGSSLFFDYGQETIRLRESRTDGLGSASALNVYMPHAGLIINRGRLLPFVCGRAGYPGSTINIYANGKLVGTAKTTAQGYWGISYVSVD